LIEAVDKSKGDPDRLQNHVKPPNTPRSHKTRAQPAQINFQKVNKYLAQITKIKTVAKNVLRVLRSSQPKNQQTR
jgi:hypothetical protein